MSDALSRAVSRVVKNDNCTGCGGCALVSRRISMTLSDEGWMRPVVSGKTASARHDAARFKAICPGVQLDALTPDSMRTHPTFGPYVSVWQGVAVDPDTRREGSSAGVLTAIAQYLVETGRSPIRGAGMSQKEPLRTIPVRITTREEALAASGSRYAPVATLADLPSDTAALIGKPCEVAALRRLNAENPPILLSFFCAGTPSQHATERLVESLGLRAADVRSLQYRGNGWPGEFTAVGGQETANASYDESWGKHLGRDLQWRCKICPDGTGEYADIAVGDYWLADARGYPLFDNADGQSVVIARTTRGHDLLLEAVAAGRISLSTVDLAGVDRVQPLQRARRKTLGPRLLARLLTFKRVPRYRGFHIAERILENPRLSARTLIGTLARSWRDRINGRHT